MEKIKSFLVLDNKGTVLDTIPGLKKAFKLVKEENETKIDFKLDFNQHYLKSKLLPAIEDGVEYFYNFQTLKKLKG